MTFGGNKFNYFVYKLSNIGANKGGVARFHDTSSRDTFFNRATVNRTTVKRSDSYGAFTRSSKRPANFQQMYSKYTC